MNKILVLGHGIAGAMLSYTLEKRGLDVWVADDPGHTGSSQVAAGIVNPVTGKRYVKSWRFETFREKAESTYRALEAELGIVCLRDRNIVRLLGSVEEANNWASRCALPDYADFLSETADAGVWAPYLQPGFFTGLIRQAAQIDYKTLCNALLHRLEQRDRLWNRLIGYDEALQQTAHFDAVVFCEGAGGAANPFFPEIKWQPAKGEGILVAFHDDTLQQLLHEPDNAHLPMLKKDLVVAAPGGRWEGLSWVGANFIWEFSDNKPTPEGKQQIAEGLRKIIRVPFSVKGQFAGIRPVVKDRRPVLGPSREHPKIYCFNALGAKGGLLAPYWAEHLADYMLLGQALDAEVDVRRFHLATSAQSD